MCLNMTRERAATAGPAAVTFSVDMDDAEGIADELRYPETSTERLDAILYELSLAADPMPGSWHG